MPLIVRTFMSGGIMMWPIVLIGMVLLGICLRFLWLQYVRDGADPVGIQSCLDGLLFWGAFAVLIGVLGTAIGVNKSIGAIISRGLVNPGALWMGAAEAMVSTLFGLMVLVASGSAWFIFRWLHLNDHYGSRA